MARNIYLIYKGSILAYVIEIQGSWSGLKLSQQ